MIFNDTYFQPDAPDPVLKEDTVMAAAARHTSNPGRLLEIDESGGEARAYILDSGIVIKTQRPHRLRPRTSLSKEAMFLEELSRAGNFPVPEVLGYGHVEGIEYLCLTQIAGVASHHLHLTTTQRSELLHTLGELLHAIHTINQTRLRSTGLLPGDQRPADLQQRFTDIFDRLAEALGDDDPWQGDLDIRGLAHQQIHRLPNDTKPVALHSNPGPEHVFADPATGRFTGLIDFGDAYTSHPALDLRPWRNPADTTDLLAGYQAVGPLPNGFETVLTAGLIISELTHVGRGSQNPHEAAARIRKATAPTQ